MPKRTLGPDRKIKRLDKGGASADGLKVMFDIVTNDDNAHPFWLAGTDLEKFIIYIIGLSQHAAGSTGKMTAPPARSMKTAQPIEAIDLGVAAGRAAGESILSVHLGTFELLFALKTNRLESFRQLLNQALRPTESPGSH